MWIPEFMVNVNFRFSREGDPEPMITSLGWHIDGEIDQAEADIISNQWADSDMSIITTSDTTYLGCEITVGGDDQSELVTWESTAGSGTGSGDPPASPPNTALLVRKLTTRGGRKGRGRCFYPEVQQNAVDPNGELTTVALGNYQDAWDDWMAELEGTSSFGDGFRLFHTNSPATDGPPNLITNFVVDGKVATQRRRLRP